MPRIRQHVLGELAATLAAGAALVTPVASASTGGTAVPPQSGAGGGTEYGSVFAAGPRPVASRFGVSPARVVAGGTLPQITLRVDQAGVPRVRARIVLWPLSGKGRLVRIDLGRMRTGRLLRPAWPARTQLVPGRYVVRVHAADPAGRGLLRKRRAPGRSTLTVVAPPVPPRVPPAPVPAPLPPAIPTGAPGTFPVAGPHTYGDGFGAARGDHRHQGVDVLAAEGLAVVAPTAGIVRFTDFEAGGAGEYVVLRSITGPDFFFAHCVRGSTRVTENQAVTERQPLCAVGSTGRSSAPHLHFELWPKGWRTGAEGSVPVDPLRQLKAWEG